MSCRRFWDSNKHDSLEEKIFFTGFCAEYNVKVDFPVTGRSHTYFQEYIVGAAKGYPPQVKKSHIFTLKRHKVTIFAARSHLCITFTEVTSQKNEGKSHMKIAQSHKVTLTLLQPL